MSSLQLALHDACEYATKLHYVLHSAALIEDISGTTTTILNEMAHDADDLASRISNLRLQLGG
jgi:hypothetical protein